MGITSLRFIFSPFYLAWSFGLPLALFALLLGLGCSWFYGVFSPELFPGFYKDFLPKAILILSVSCVWFAHFSYNRIHQPKLFLWLYLSGFSFLWPWAAQNFAPDFFSKNLEQWGYVVCVAFGIFSLLLPSDIAYARLKNISWLLCLCYGLAAFTLNRFFPGQNLVELVGFEKLNWIIIGFAGITAILGFVHLSSQFFLPGILIGFLFLWYGQISAKEWVEDFNQLEILWKWAIPNFAILATFSHWLFKISHNITYDPLMGVYNRAYCNKIISGQSSLNIQPPFCVAMIDIDHFKKVNDTHGHQAGDAVLSHVAQTIKKNLGTKGVLCRYGGEEMIVFLPKQSAKQALQILESLRVAVKKLRVNMGKKKLKVTISSGVAERIQKNQDIEDLIAAADKAVYKAKKGGRDQVQLGKIPAKR